MPARKRRRWFSLSLRTLLIGMTLVSVGFAWFLHHRRAKIAERERLSRKLRSPNSAYFVDSILGWDLPYGDAENDKWYWLRLAAIPRIHSMSLSIGPSTVPSDDVLAAAQKAHEVELYQHQYSPQLLAKVLSTNTTDLSLTGNGLADQIVEISRAPNLQNLTYNGLIHNLKPVAAILDHQHLQHSHFGATAVLLSDLRASRPSGLRTLGITFPPATDLAASDVPGDYPWLRACTQVNDLYCIHPSNNFLAQIGRHLEGVEKLDLISDSLPEAVDNLAGWARLRHLSLRYCRIEDAVLAKIAIHLPQLESLEIEGEEGGFSPDGLRPLKEMPHLNRLALEQCGLTKEHVEVIAGCAELQQLSLFDNRLDDQSLAPLSGLSRLKQLDLEATSATAKAFANIRGGWKPRRRGW
jgi:Leucine-rich repeat (LRR) protein